MSRKKEKRTALTAEPVVDGDSLFARVVAIIENRKQRAGAYANCEVTMMFWEIGRYVNTVVLDGGRAEYGKQIFSTLSRKLMERYGTSFQRENLYRMAQFANVFPDGEIVSALSTQLSWSHFCEVIRLQTMEARLYYANEAAVRRLGIRELRRQISRKAYERREIANSNLTDKSTVPFNIFKDPYILDTLGLKENYPEADLEKAILTELQSFILEFGHGITFVGRQKRFTFGNEDYYPDLLFYHRDLRRLIVVELKIGKFEAEYTGQMLLYLKWLNRYERREGENAPIGLILCTLANRGLVELLELDQSGIAVAELWTALPSKTLLEEKISQLLAEAKERLARRIDGEADELGRLVGLARVGARQVEFDRAGHQRRRDDEDHEQHQHHVHQRRDVDVRQRPRAAGDCQLHRHLFI
jgi:predicted nuclease of restriction endonuclease-like (RecB) superfamily